MQTNLNWRKLKLFIKFHWIKVLVVSCILLLVISLVIFISAGITAWRNLDSFYKQMQLAALPLQIYLYTIGAVIMAPIYVFLWYWVLMRGGGVKQFTEIKKSPVAGESVGVTWKDIIGLDEAKQEAMEVVRLITDRAQLQQIGGKILRGILMIGPPGCGKTHLARAIATESNLPFISMSGSEFVEMFVGVGASRIRKLFNRAQQLAYAEGGCIIFIDEIDAVGAQRAMDQGFGGTTEHNTTLNQLLVEMDGLKNKDSNVVIIGATNAPLQILDQALLRPGRFDRKIHVGLPDLTDRELLFDYYLKKIKAAPGINIPRLSRKAVYKSPADIANIVSEATLIAIRKRKDAVGMDEISEAMERIEMGIKRKIKMTESERREVAYHEAGHLIAMFILHPTDDVFKASIIARGDALGMVVHQPREELFTYSKARMLADIKVSLGGYVAEKIKFGMTSSGVSSDFSKAMLMAHRMVWSLGMGESMLVGDYDSIPEKQISEEIKQKLNHETQKIMQDCLKDVEELLRNEMTILERFAQELLVREELDFDEIETIFKEYGRQKANPGA